MIVYGYSVEKHVFSVFSSKSMLWVNAYKLAAAPSAPPYLLTRGAKGQLGWNFHKFDSLSDLFQALHEHEVDALVEKAGIPAMAVLAMAVSEEFSELAFK